MWGRRNGKYKQVIDERVKAASEEVIREAGELREALREIRRAMQPPPRPTVVKTK